MSVSYWQQRASTGRAPDRIAADLVVLGAGITGLSAAIEAERRGLRCVVAEKRTPGAGASGRNAGYLMRGMAENYARATRELGRERARDVWATSEENLRDLKSLGLASLPSYRPMPSCIVAGSDEEGAELEASIPMLAEDGFGARLVRPGEKDAGDDLWAHTTPELALLNPNDATVNPMELVGMLKGALATTMVLEQAEAYAVEMHDDGTVTVRTPEADLTAPRVLVAMNAYAGSLFPALAPMAVPNRGQMLRFSPAIGARPVRLDHAYYINFGGEYLRADHQGHVIIGGCRAAHADAERTADDGVTEAVQADLERGARDLLGPALDGHEVTARWAGTMGFSPDGLPVVTPISTDGTATDASPIWFCGGFTGHGMSLAHRTAKRTVGALLGEHDTPFPGSRLQAT